MKVLFITFYEPDFMGIRILASILNNNGHDVHILQCKNYIVKELKDIPDDKSTNFYLMYTSIFATMGESVNPITEIELNLLCNFIKTYSPDIICTTSKSPNDTLVCNIIQVIKRKYKNSFIVSGGFGPTLNPVQYLQAGSDFVVRGEGEGVLLDIVNYVSNSIKPYDVYNVSYLKNESIINNPLRPMITNLDSIPFPIFDDIYFTHIEDDTINNGKLLKNNTNNYQIMQGRGCIKRCSYCCAGGYIELYRNLQSSVPRHRKRSLDSLFTELRYAKDKNVNFIEFLDEYLVFNTKDLHTFLDRYVREINLPFFAYFPPQQISRDTSILKKLINAGLRQFILGVQSGSQEFCKQFYNRMNNNKDLLTAINAATKEGLEVIYHLIGGNPYESEEDFKHTLNFVKNINFDKSMKSLAFLNNVKLKLLPGSPLYHSLNIDSFSFDNKLFFYKSVITSLRNIVSCKEFDSIIADKSFQENPFDLHVYRWNLLHKLHYEYIDEQVNRLRGENVYFWGCGEIYTNRKNIFKSLKPKCILVDTSYITKNCKIDGLEILHPDDVLTTGEILPIVIFSYKPNIIYRKILKKYPQFTDIVVCAML